MAQPPPTVSQDRVNKKSSSLMPSLHPLLSHHPLHAKSSPVKPRDTHQYHFEQSFGYTEPVNINEHPWVCYDRSKHIICLSPEHAHTFPVPTGYWQKFMSIKMTLQAAIPWCVLSPLPSRHHVLKHKLSPTRLGADQALLVLHTSTPGEDSSPQWAQAMPQHHIFTNTLFLLPSYSFR